MWQQLTCGMPRPGGVWQSCPTVQTQSVAGLAMSKLVLTAASIDDRACKGETLEGRQKF